MNRVACAVSSTLCENEPSPQSPSESPSPRLSKRSMPMPSLANCLQMRLAAGESFPRVNPCAKTPQPLTVLAGLSMTPVSRGPLVLGNQTRSATSDIVTHGVNPPPVGSGGVGVVREQVAKPGPFRPAGGAGDDEHPTAVWVGDLPRAQRPVTVVEEAGRLLQESEATPQHCLPVTIIGQQGEEGAAVSRSLVLTLALESAVPPFATDMYTPAFPRVTADLATSASLVGLTLTTFFLGMALGQP